MLKINYLVLVLSHVFSKPMSGPESFVAEVAGDDNSFEMVCFDVISYVSDMALFSTHFATYRNGREIC